MESSASATLVNNLTTNILLNFNFAVIINLLLYSASATAGVLIASKLITIFFEEFIRSKIFRSDTKFKIKMEEITELNKKIHDRLSEVEHSINLGDYPSEKTRKRLLTTTARIQKYDNTIVEDVYRVLNGWTVALTLKERGYEEVSEVIKSRNDSLLLIKKIRAKIDKLVL